MRALLSVSDKRGIVEFARELVALKWEIVSTGGTAEALRREQVPVIGIEDVTGFPEMMDGRVKTLHPKVHGGLLARRDNPHDVAAMKQHGITPIDLVAVNLYPFRETVAKAQTTFAQAIEQIDIGGPSMLRSAAKNHQSVIVVVDPEDYPSIITRLKDGGVAANERQALAAKVFAHTAAYDAAILGYLSRSQESLPPVLSLGLQRQQSLRYGENPHQRAALYVMDEPGVKDMHQLHGKELSFNNLLDVDAAVMAIAPWHNKDSRPACVIIKHTTPCGIALGRNAADAYQRALATDKTSAFGSVIAFNTVVDRAAAEAMRELFVEVVVAPRVDAEALAVFQGKKNLRVVELPPPPRGGRANARLQARAGRIPRAGPLPLRGRGRRIQMADRHNPAPHGCAMERLAVRLGGRGVYQVERHRAGQGRGRHRDRRRADEPRRLIVSGRP